VNVWLNSVTAQLVTGGQLEIVDTDRDVGNHICHIGELHDVGLDYLKIDSAIIRDIDQSVGNQAFLRGLCGIAHTMSMMTIAEGVSNQRELACLMEIGFKGMTGPGVMLG